MRPARPAEFVKTTVLRLPDANHGRALLAELQRRLPEESFAELRIRSFAGETLLFVPDTAWRSNWMDDLVSGHGARIVAFDVPATVADADGPRIVLEPADPADASLRELVATLLLRRRLGTPVEAATTTPSAVEISRELQEHEPGATIEIVPAGDAQDAQDAQDARPGERGGAVVWRIRRTVPGQKA